MTRLPTRRGIGAPRRRGVRLPTAANVPQATPRSDPGVTVPEGAFGNGLALEELGAAIGDVGETIRKEERKRAAEEALKEAARRREEQKSKGADELEQPPKPELKPEAPPESEPLSSVEDDVRAVKLRDVALNARMNDVLVGGEGSEGYLSSQGEAAMAAYGPTRQALIALAEDYLGQVGNERVRRQLEPVAAARVKGNLAAAKRHRDAQRPVAENDASNARIDNAIADATGRPDDPGAILQAQAVVYDETLQIAEREGKNEEEARHAANNAVGRLHTGVVEALVDRDPSAAHAYLATNRDAVAPSARAELDALVQEGLIPVVAEPVAREIHASGGTPEERRRAAARYVEHNVDSRIAPESIPELRQAIARGLDLLDAEDAAQTRTEVDKANEVVREVVDAGGDVDDAPATVRRTLRQHDPESLDAEAEVAAKRRRGEVVKTVPIAFKHLVYDAVFRTNEFVRRDLVKERAWLNPEDHAFLTELQEQLKAGGESAGRTRALWRTIVRKAEDAIVDRNPNIAAEKFHGLITIIRDLQYLEGRPAKEADIDALLADEEMLARLFRDTNTPRDFRNVDYPSPIPNVTVVAHVGRIARTRHKEAGLSEDAAEAKSKADEHAAAFLLNRLNVDSADVVELFTEQDAYANRQKTAQTGQAAGPDSGQDDATDLGDRDDLQSVDNKNSDTLDYVEKTVYEKFREGRNTAAAGLAGREALAFRTLMSEALEKGASPETIRYLVGGLMVADPTRPENLLSQMDDATRANLLDTVMRLDDFYVNTLQFLDVDLIPPEVEGLIATAAAEGTSAELIRRFYQNQIKKMSREALGKFRNAGDMATKKAIAEKASEQRNRIFKTARRIGMPIGHAIANMMKSEGLEFDDLLDRYTSRTFRGRQWSDLNDRERAKVFQTIIEKSGADNKKVTEFTRGLGKAGKVLWFVTAGFAVFEVLAADDKVHAAARSAASIGGGAMGAWIGGKIGLICLEASPICVPLGAIVGGIVGAKGMEELVDFVMD